MMDLHFLCGLLGLALALPTTAWAAGSGLTGEYYDNSDFTSLKFTRLDPVVDFNWDAASPSNTMSGSTFSVRWSGQVEPRFSEVYTFYVSADDGARLWVNDQLLLSRSTYSAVGAEMSGRLRLQAGQRVNLMLEYVQDSGNARVSLAWVSASQPRQLIPQSQLYPAMVSREAGSILVEHWLNVPGTNLSALTTASNYPNRPDGREFLTRFECLQTEWADDYGTRATGCLLAPSNGVYTFAVSGSDAVQLFLSPDESPAHKQLIASNAVPTGFRQFTNSSDQVSAPLTLTGQQKYYVELLHKAGSGSDHFSVGWKPPGATSFTVVPAEALVPAGLDRVPPAQAAYFDTLVPGHPRLLASAQRFEWLRRALASNSIPQLTSWWGSVSNSARSILSQPVNVYNSAGILDESRSVLERVYKCALVYQVTGATNFAERAWSELQQVASTNFPDWNPAHFLDTAEMTHACAIGYDWLYNYWTPAQRDTLRTAIIDKGLKQSLTLYTNNSGWVAAGNNWNLVCNGGMILGALAVGNEWEGTAEYILSKAIPSAAAAMRRYTTDNGLWYEGPMYWSYATSYNIRLLAGLESALGSDFGLSQIPGLAETGMESLYMVGPGSRVAFNFADASAYNLRGFHLFWLARRFNRPEFSWWCLTNSGVEPLDLLWYDGRGADPQAAGLPPDNYFRGPTGTTAFAPAEVLTLRSGWLDGDATFVGFKAGELGATHGHLDGGSFVLEALGVRWAYDSGGDSYSLPGYFSKPQRWTYYRLRAEGHNTLVINPGAGEDQVSGARLPVLLYTSEPQAERSAAVMDLTGAYGISKVWRGIQLFKNRRWVLVQDELQAQAPAEVWWFMHYRSSTTQAAIEDNGASALLTQGSDRLWLSIVSGGGSFVISNTVPLPSSPNPSGQANNDSYRKLAIHLTGVTNTTLAVLIVPLGPRETPPVGSLSLIPLADWATAMAQTPASRTNNEVRWSGAATPLWDTNAFNWRSVSADAVTQYVDGRPGNAVRFDDTLTANPAITLLGTVSPESITFSNTATAYSLSGPGGLSGAGGLWKSGTNTVTLATSNSFGGAVSVGGRLVLRHSAALGPGPKTITVKSSPGMFAELHLDGSRGPLTLPGDYNFSTFGDAAFAGNIVNDAGDNVINSYFNMTSGGSHTRFNVLSGSLTVNGTINCSNGSSNKQLQLYGSGTNTINGVIQNGTRLAMLGVFGGTWILNGANTYTGPTTVASNATLVINGSLANTAITVQDGGTLSGGGAIEGAVTIQPGGALCIAGSPGALHLNSDLMLQGTVRLGIGRQGGAVAQDQLCGLRSNVYGGLLVVTNLGNSLLRVGDSFRLFAATNYAGAFTRIVYPEGYVFTETLAMDGRIRVTAVPAPPGVTPGGLAKLTNGSFALTVTGTVGAPYTLWASTNVAPAPVPDRWTMVTNGTVITTPFTVQDPAATTFPWRFYLLSNP